MQLKVIDELPDRFFEISHLELKKLFGSPCLVHLKGMEKSPLVVSLCLHGNESTGLHVAQGLLRPFFTAKTESLPRDVVLMIGNVEAAQFNSRHLKDQEDMNRIWAEGETPYHDWAREVIHYLKNLRPFAAVDIHNNTGKNPHYACVNRLEDSYLHLARMFSDTVIYFIKPHQVFSMAMAPYCPTTTIECGLSGEMQGIEKALGFVEKLLFAKCLNGAESELDKVNIFHTVAKIKLPEQSRIGFGVLENEEVDFIFPANFEYFNFSTLDKNHLLGHRLNQKMQLAIYDESNTDVAVEYIEYNGLEIRLKKGLIPSMFTKDVEVAKSDCLGYVMERMEREQIKELKGKEV